MFKPPSPLGSSIPFPHWLLFILHHACFSPSHSLFPSPPLCPAHLPLWYQISLKHCLCYHPVSMVGCCMHPVCVCVVSSAGRLPELRKAAGRWRRCWLVFLAGAPALHRTPQFNKARWSWSASTNLPHSPLIPPLPAQPFGLNRLLVNWCAQFHCKISQSLLITVTQNTTCLKSSFDIVSINVSAVILAHRAGCQTQRTGN